MAATTLEGEIRTFLLTFSTITGVFGQRIYCGNIPEGATVPSVCIYRINDFESHLDPIQEISIQVSTFGVVYSDVITNSELIHVKLNRYIGTLGSLQIVDTVAGSANRLYDSNLKRWQSVRDYKIRLI